MSPDLRLGSIQRNTYTYWKGPDMKHLFVLILGATLVFGGVTASLADTSGSFRGASNHVTTGNVTVTKNADGTATITLASNFSLDGAPDPWVGLGRNGKFVPATNAGKLKSKTGGQSYTVPAGVDVDSFNEVYIYCVRFNVPLGVATLK